MKLKQQIQSDDHDALFDVRLRQLKLQDGLAYMAESERLKQSPDGQLPDTLDRRLYAQITKRKAHEA